MNMNIKSHFYIWTMKIFTQFQVPKANTGFEYKWYVNLLGKNFIIKCNNVENKKLYPLIY